MENDTMKKNAAKRKTPSKPKRAAGGGSLDRLVRPRQHYFTVAVTTSGSKKSAELAILAAFAKRDPDGCEFYLKPIDGHKETWMAGAKAGTETAFDLILRSLENMRDKFGIGRPNDEVSQPRS